ncbi:MAG TPA: protein-disulfide reductase DsbD domain-containing protein [Pyrinomonadaceae bacterium]|jgi:DsbC/DsbD-like thiol-disulfide interchange protein
MKKFIFNGLFFVFALVFAAATHAQTISGSIPAVKRGGTTKGTIVISIPGGMHVNSSRPNSEYAIPTSVKLTGAGIKLGAVSYPRGQNRKFGFSENAINVYEGRAAFSFNVTVPANFKGNTIKIRAVVRFQACTEEVCYPPKTKEVTLTARVQ